MKPIGQLIDADSAFIDDSTGLLLMHDLIPTMDNGCILTGYSQFDATIPRIIRLDSTGNNVWKGQYGEDTPPNFSIVTQDNGILMITVPDSIVHNRIVLTKVSNKNIQVWTKNGFFSNGTTVNLSYKLDTADNGDFIAAFSVSNQQGENLCVKRFNAAGNELWSNNYLIADSFLSINQICNAKDGGFLIIMNHKSNTQAKLIKIGANGSLLWQYDVNTAWKPLNVSISLDGNILLFLADNADSISPKGSRIEKLDKTGNKLWEQSYGLFATEPHWYWAFERYDNTFALIGLKDTINPSTIVFSIIDSVGTLLYQRKTVIDSNMLKSTSLRPETCQFAILDRTIKRTADGSYFIGGHLLGGIYFFQAVLIKMDSMGVVFPSTISAYTFYDKDSNCQPDSTEMIIGSSLVTFGGAIDTFRIITRNNDFYSIGANAETYSVSVSPPSSYWQPSGCNPASVTLADKSDTVIALGIQPLVSSPYIVVDGHISRQRMCMDATYKAQYCNTGTATFQGFLEVTVDTLLEVRFASQLWVSKSGNNYVFQVDSLGIMDCASLEIYFTAPCDADLTGRTTCIVARAYNDTVLNVSPLWDRSDLSMDVVYDPAKDSITFTLKNTGTGNMSKRTPLVILEDNGIYLSDSVQLQSPGQLEYSIKANGATFRAIAPQSDYNPYSAFATAAIEGAGFNQQGKVSIGYLKQYAYNEYYGYNYTACEAIYNSYDPNHKSVTPEGAGANHIIDSTTALEYTLEFQNTGNDTAYLVRIKDTLPAFLDIVTVKQGVSSHNCNMDIIGKNTLLFTFGNINLPDSATNPAGSNGFVKFKVKQKPNNAMGTVIDNKVSIYFDYNPPIVTNTATVRIGELRVTGIESIYANKLLQVNAFPNPFKDKTTIKIEGERFAQLELKVFDISGRQVKQQITYNTDGFIIDKQGFSSGSYIFEISSNGKPVARGKIVAE